MNESSHLLVLSPSQNWDEWSVIVVAIYLYVVKRFMKVPEDNLI